MKNNNFDIIEALWLRRERKRRAQKTIEGVPPLTFKAKEGTLKNYRIYGNTVNSESVGDLVTEGEHAGEYKVPVTVEGKNLLPNTATSQTINGVTFTVNSDGSVTCNGTASVSTFFLLKQHLQLEERQSYYLTGCPTGGGGSSFRVYAQTDLGVNFYLDSGNGAIINYISQLEVLIVIYSGYTCENLTFYPMIRKADIEDDTYEPYHAPVTTPIYLPEQIKKVGDETEYIDYAEQKQHFVGGTSVDVTLPALPTIAGTNTLSVGTQVQPSKVMVRGKLKE